MLPFLGGHSPFVVVEFAVTLPSHQFKIFGALTTFSKAGDANPMRIGGVVSTESLDEEDEVIVQKGLDFSPFMSSGWFNDNHSKQTVDVLGFPTDARYIQKGQALPDGTKSKVNGWWAEGYLLNTPKAVEIWKLAKALEGTPRQLGFSIEGGVRERDVADPSIVTRGVVRNVAITHCPVNTETSLQTFAKALTAGSAINNPGASPGEGFPLRQSSMVVGAAYINPPTLSTEDAAKLLKAARPQLSDAAIARIVRDAITPPKGRAQ